MKKEREKIDEKVPLFKSWIVWYAITIGNLAILIILFYLISKIYQ